MQRLISVPEAAEVLHLDPSRVRALAAAGRLSAFKIGHRWAIDSASVAERSRSDVVRGRPIAAHNAWALLCLASGSDPSWVSPQVRSRLRRVLRLEGLPALIGRLGGRASIRRFQAHPGEVARVAADPDLVRSGVSAAGELGLDLVAGVEADGYVSEARVEKVIRRHALREVPGGERANVKLRVVPASAWHLVDTVAPEAAVAIDLLDDVDPRSRRAGKSLLARVAKLR